MAVKVQALLIAVHVYACASAEAAPEKKAVETHFLGPELLKETATRVGDQVKESAERVGQKMKGMLNRIEKMSSAPKLNGKTAPAIMKAQPGALPQLHEVFQRRMSEDPKGEFSGEKCEKCITEVIDAVGKDDPAFAKAIRERAIKNGDGGIQEKVTMGGATKEQAIKVAKKFQEDCATDCTECDLCKFGTCSETVANWADYDANKEWPRVEQKQKCVKDTCKDLCNKDDADKKSTAKFLNVKEADVNGRDGDAAGAGDGDEAKSAACGVAFGQISISLGFVSMFMRTM